METTIAQTAFPVLSWDTDEARWQAVLDRVAAADGAFYYAVRTTGVFCRPTCPARRPRRDRVLFFDTPEGAAGAGFRPCRRCRPDEVADWQRVVARVRELLDTDERPPTLAALGAAVGLSPSHLQRVFKRATGLSPREYAAAGRAGRLRHALRAGTPVTAALYDAGYGSPQALYAAAPAALGMAPTAYRQGGAGERVAYDVLPTPLGPLLLAATPRGLCAVRFATDATPGTTNAPPPDAPSEPVARESGTLLDPAAVALVDALRADLPRAALVRDPAGVAPYARAVLDHLAGRRRRLDLPLDVAATPFQGRVWAALREIPYGETRTYAQVARMIGQPDAARAVARACATNPLAVVVPCHRVVPAGGAPRASASPQGYGGYRWGVERKRRLLRAEGAA